MHAVWQQTPCSQKLERHSFRFAQIAPVGLRPQEPPVHTAGGRQSASAMHDALQAKGRVVPQRYGKQDVVPGVTQVPAPSQADSGVNRSVVVGQVEGRQGVPDAYRWQAPASHLPFLPQVDGSAATQMPAGSGDPVATFEQTPGVPAVHDLHAQLQAVSQQTPCAQNVLRHSAAAEHAAPFSFSPQHVGGAAERRHALVAVGAGVEAARVPLQMYGLHGIRTGASHWPLALQVDGRL